VGGVGGAQCGAGNACVNNMCEACGTEGKACCPGFNNRCAQPLNCSNQKCIACGAKGETCCRTAQDQLFCNNNLACDDTFKCN